MTQTYAFLKVGGEDCPCRIPAVFHNAIVGYTCGKDKQDCDEKRCQNCPHGKTLEEMAEQTRPIMCQWFSHILKKHLSAQWLYQIPFMEWVARHGKTFVYMFLKALLGGEDK